MFNVHTVKKQFPIFTHYPNLVYLDSAATSQKPQVVIDRIKQYYEQENANVHRGIYKLAEKATKAYEEVREKVASFIGATDKGEIVFTRGATEAINIVAHGFAFGADDEVVITEMEHHSNLVPWQRKVMNYELQITNYGLKIKEKLKFIPIAEDGVLDLSTLPQLVTKKTRIVALTYVSNVLGTLNPIKKIVQLVKEINPKTLVLVDGAQAVGHIQVNVQDLGCDFFAFSGHKMCGPTGVGVLWGRKELLEQLEPYQYGGSMISRVEKYHTKWADVPYKFEAGTPHVAGVIGLGAAIDFLQKIGMEAICEHEKTLTSYAMERLINLQNVSLYGPKEATKRLGIMAFNIDNLHAHDVAQVLDDYQIAVRAGHHCAMPLHECLGITASVRASVYLYNTKHDIDQLARGIEYVKKLFHL